MGWRLGGWATQCQQAQHTQDLPRGSLLARLPSPSPTRDGNCWLWEGKGIASSRGRGPPTAGPHPSVMNNTQVHPSRRVYACLSVKITLVSFCLKSKRMDVRLTEGLAGRHRAGLGLSQLLSSGGGVVVITSRSSLRRVPRTCRKFGWGGGYWGSCA